jgi:flagellar motor protein MotB
VLFTSEGLQPLSADEVGLVMDEEMDEGRAPGTDAGVLGGAAAAAAAAEPTQQQPQQQQQQQQRQRQQGLLRTKEKVEEEEQQQQPGQQQHGQEPLQRHWENNNVIVQDLQGWKVRLEGATARISDSCFPTFLVSLLR